MTGNDSSRFSALAVGEAAVDPGVDAVTAHQRFYPLVCVCLFPLLRSASPLSCLAWFCAAVQYPDDEESLAAALDELLDNPDFLDAVADELMYQVGRQQHSIEQQQGSYLMTGLRPHG
jgi:hypothetical protein